MCLLKGNGAAAHPLGKHDGHEQTSTMNGKKGLTLLAVLCYILSGGSRTPSSRRSGPGGNDFGSRHDEPA